MPHTRGLALLFVVVGLLGGCQTPSAYQSLNSADSASPYAASAESGAAVASDQAGESAPVVRHQDSEYEADAEEEAGLFSTETLSSLAPSNVFKSIRQSTPWRIDEEEGRKHMAEAEELYRQKKYAEAAEKFDDAAFKWPDSVLEEDALFYLGECCFFTDEYPDANEAYADLLKKYSNTRHLDVVMKRQFRIAQYWQQINRIKPHWTLTPNFTDDTRPWFDTDGNSLATYESVWTGDPTGPLADDSVLEVANAYFIEERYLDADYYYDLLREQHPQSEHLMQAFTLGLQAKLRTYQGPGYDPASVVESEKLIDQMLTQFPNELGAERERVLETRRRVRELLAERQWHMAEYYDKNGHYGAARYHLKKVLNEHADTSFGPRAQQRLAEIADLPANPPDRLKWVKDVLPEAE